MTDKERRILQMLDEKKISVDEAARLLEAVRQTGGLEANPDNGRPRKEQPKYLRIQVQPDASREPDAERVNIRVPMALLHAGMKLTSLIPSQAANQVNEALNQKGINIDVRNFKPEQFEQLIDALGDLQVDVDSAKEKVRIYVE